MQASRREESKSSDAKRGGVWTLRLHKAETSDFVELEGIRGVCLHNADVCYQSGSKEKAKVWDTLAKVVEGQLLVEDKSSYDGWRGGSMGVCLVQGLLQFYESRGDVQMLSAIVCVLQYQRTETSSWSMLPEGEAARFDSYLRLYSDMLFSWGLVAERAELRKHMLRPDDDADEIQIHFQCPRCGEAIDHVRNYCTSCKDFCFRCVLCDSAVRGLFVACDL